MTGAKMIITERKRQIEVEGWTPEHDDKEHTTTDLISAAVCYANAWDEHSEMPRRWPWNPKWWKPKDRIRNLVRAGALYKAAIDRAKRNKEPNPRSAIFGTLRSQRIGTIKAIAAEIDRCIRLWDGNKQEG